MAKRMVSKETLERQAEYDATHCTQIKMKLNNKTDADIIQFLGTLKNKQGYLKSLIRADIENRSNGTQN